MKIGIDCRLWSETGVGRYIRNLVGQLQEIDKENEYVLFVLSKDREQINSQFAIRNLQLVNVDIRWHSVDEQMKFPEILYKENLDLMHFPYFSVPILYKRPFVITIHDLIIHHHGTGKASTLPQPFYHMKRAGYKYILSQAARKAEKIIVPLNAVKEDVIDTLGVKEEKIVVTHEGVDRGISNFQFPISNFKLKKIDYFLYVGNAYPHKNLERLVEAYAQLIGRHSGLSRISYRSNESDSGRRQNDDRDVKLVLVGKEDFFYKRLKEMVKKMGLSDSIIFKHDVSDKELSELYVHARALISPSLMEGFGLPPLEAMALSCPVLLSDIPSFREVCGNAAFYFNPYSVGAIRERMEYVYGITDGTRKEHVERGLERVKEFSWKEMAEETLKVYEGSNSLR
jgi:glycosyltransferase involved in cell wall biosynthesis